MAYSSDIPIGPAEPAGPSGRRTIRTAIGPEADRKRLDLFLAERFTYRSRSQWQETVRKGEILVNGRAARPSRILRAGEEVEFVPDESELAEPPVDEAFTIEYETPDFLAAGKPGNLPVHPSGRYFRHTLLMLLRERCGEVYPVNRLDRETSGLILFAKTPRAAKLLTKLFEDGRIRKTYQAVVHGVFPARIEARGYLGPDPESVVTKKRKFFRERPSGDPGEIQTAETEFRLLASDGSRSLVECTPHTGRLHQIRATLFSLGFPLLGDKLYGPDDALFLRQAAGTLTEEDRASLILPNQALHAQKLEFVSPFTGEKICLTVPAPFAVHPAVSGLFRSAEGSGTSYAADIPEDPESAPKDVQIPSFLIEKESVRQNG